MLSCVPQPTNISTGKHIGILQRLIVTLGHTEKNDSEIFAQVEHGRTHQIAYILYKQQRIFHGQFIERRRYHTGIEVTTIVCIDLYGWNTQIPDTSGIIVGMLVSLYYGNLMKTSFTQPFNSAFE